MRWMGSRRDLKCYTAGTSIRLVTERPWVIWLDILNRSMAVDEA